MLICWYMKILKHCVMSITPQATFNNTSIHVDGCSPTQTLATITCILSTHCLCMTSHLIYNTFLNTTPIYYLHKTQHVLLSNTFLHFNVMSITMSLHRDHHFTKTHQPSAISNIYNGQQHQVTSTKPCNGTLWTILDSHNEGYEYLDWKTLFSFVLYTPLT